MNTTLMCSQLHSERITCVKNVQGLFELGERNSREPNERALGGYLLVEWKVRIFLMAMVPEKKAWR